MAKPLVTLPVMVLCLGFAPAQQLSTTFGARPGDTITTATSGKFNQIFLTLLDLHGGPVQLFGVDLYLGLTPNLTIIQRGVIPSSGNAVRSYKLPLGISPGLRLYFQSALVDSAAPNGMFRVTDGETTTVYLARYLAGTDFVDPAAAGFVGNYDKSVKGRLMAAPVTYRVVTYTAPRGVLFRQPVAGDLNKTGVRIQKVYRAVDLGATGVREVLTAIHWEAFRGGPVVDQIIPSMSIDVSHSKVVPDFTLDPWSSFPKFPNSGLSKTLADNRSSNPVRVFGGAYTILAKSRNGWFVPYPRLQQEFEYDGVSSLLLDFAVQPSPLSKTQNGQQIYLMVTSSPRPFARVQTPGVSNPNTVRQALIGDNAQTGMRFEFARVYSQATSPWQGASIGSPDYQTPYLGASIPAGASIAIEYRGSKSSTGSSATDWSSSVDIADGHPFLQYRVTFRAAVSGARPSLDALLIPMN